ncbi:hypothetical protein ACH4UY_21645 [Streptomyces longwoodensis]|uniref:hypothetical protein n=1 Tax=Streptomyces longwoodensis TaxID=68231 RepID=UPI00379175C7
MGNTFGAGDDQLYLSNGGTDVFVEVLLLAVSGLARCPWEYRFGGLVARQDQELMGRGAVGFDLTEIHWGRTAPRRDAAKQFVLRAIGLAGRRYRWELLGYEPPHALAYLRRFREVVTAFEPPETEPDRDVLPDLSELGCCVRHRVLSPVAHLDGCLFCRGSRGEAYGTGLGSEWR